MFAEALGGFTSENCLAVTVSLLQRLFVLTAVNLLGRGRQWCMCLLLSAGLRYKPPEAHQGGQWGIREHLQRMGERRASEGSAQIRSAH